jgi:hypothetical protein
MGKNYGGSILAALLAAPESDRRLLAAALYPAAFGYQFPSVMQGHSPAIKEAE